MENAEAACQQVLTTYRHLRAEITSYPLNLYPDFTRLLSGLGEIQNRIIMILHARAQSLPVQIPTDLRVLKSVIDQTWGDHNALLESPAYHDLFQRLTPDHLQNPHTFDGGIRRDGIITVTNVARQNYQETFDSGARIQIPNASSPHPNEFALECGRAFHSVPTSHFPTLGLVVHREKGTQLVRKHDHEQSSPPCPRARTTMLCR